MLLPYSTLSRNRKLSDSCAHSPTEKTDRAMPYFAALSMIWPAILFTILPASPSFLLKYCLFLLSYRVYITIYSYMHLSVCNLPVTSRKEVYIWVGLDVV